MHPDESLAVKEADGGLPDVGKAYRIKQNTSVNNIAVFMVK